MTRIGRLVVCGICSFFISAGVCRAELIDRGGGLIYDSVLNVTWLQDAQYALTTGAAPFGNLSWDGANAWAAGLQYEDTARGVVWDDWRLPATVTNLNSLTWDVTGQSSELAYMYYVNLGYLPNYSFDTESPSPTSSNYNPFLNLSYRGYWSETPGEFPNLGMMFHFHFGFQAPDGTAVGQKVWAVRDGDVGVASVPEPTTLALLGLGIAGAGLRRRRTLR